MPPTPKGEFLPPAPKGEAVVYFNIIIAEYPISPFRGQGANP